MVAPLCWTGLFTLLCLYHCPVVLVWPFDLAVWELCVAAGTAASCSAS